MNKIFKMLLITLCTNMIISCGQKGSLYLPKEDLPKETAKNVNG